MMLNALNIIEECLENHFIGCNIQGFYRFYYNERSLAVSFLNVKGEASECFR